MVNTTDNQKKAADNLRRQDSDREELDRNKYFDRTRQPKQTNSSRGDFDKVENLFFDIGYWTSKGSIDFSVGMISGILTGLKDMVFGCVEVIKNSKNPITQYLSKQALFNSATNNLPESQKEDLAKGVKISDDEYRKTATSIDSLFRNNSALKNNDGSIEYGEYTFQLKELENGDRQYIRSRSNSEIGTRVELFILDSGRNVVTVNNTFSQEDNTKSLESITNINNAGKVSQTDSIEKTQSNRIGGELTKISNKVTILCESINAITINNDRSTKESANISNNLIKKQIELLNLQVEVNTLSSAIENETNDSSNIGSQSIDSLSNKLFAINKSIEAVSVDLVSKKSLVISLNTSEIVKEAQTNIERAESTNPFQSENTTSTYENTIEGKMDITTTPIETGFSGDVDESEIDYNYMQNQY